MPRTEGKAETLSFIQSTKSAWYEVTINILGFVGVATDHASCNLSFDSPVSTAAAAAPHCTANASISSACSPPVPQKKAIVSVLRNNLTYARTELSSTIIRSAINDILIPTEANSGPAAAEKVAAQPQRGGILDLLGLHRFVALWDGNISNINSGSGSNIKSSSHSDVSHCPHGTGSTVTFDCNLTVSPNGTKSETIQLMVALVDANSSDSMLSSTLVGTCSFTIGERTSRPRWPYTRSPCTIRGPQPPRRLPSHSRAQPQAATTSSQQKINKAFNEISI
jgi:hypothetical protein